MGRLLTLLFICWFLSPYLILALHLTEFSRPPFSELLRVLAVSTGQAGVSAVVSCLMGVIGSFGLLSIGPRLRRVVEAWAILPNAVPTLLVILAVLNVMGPMAIGWIGVVTGHVILNAGLVAVLGARILQSKVGGMAELAAVEGARRWQLNWVLLRYLRADFGYLFLFVFAMCFTSFSVPLVLGGRQAMTLDVLIYEKLSLTHDLSQALFLSGLQSLFILTFATLFARQHWVSVRNLTTSPLLQWRPGLFILLALTGSVVIGLLQGIPKGISSLLQSPDLVSYAFSLAGGTLLVSLLVGLMTYVGLCWTAWQFPDVWLSRFLLGWVAPSAALTAFALILLPGGFNTTLTQLKISLGLCLMTFPAFYRLGWASALGGLQRQIETAFVLGASRRLIFSDVIWPQVRSTAFFLAGLASFWASGEFALSGIVAGRDVTLAIVVHKLMQSYRLEAATVLVWLVLALGLFCFLIFWGIGHVFGSQSRT